MQRTKKTRGAKAFQMRSGKSPLPFLGKAIGKIFGKKGGDEGAGVDPTAAAEAKIASDPSGAAEQLNAIKAIVSDDEQGVEGGGVGLAGKLLGK